MSHFAVMVQRGFGLVGTVVVVLVGAGCGNGRSLDSPGGGDSAVDADGGDPAMSGDPGGGDGAADADGGDPTAPGDLGGGDRAENADGGEPAGGDTDPGLPPHSAGLGGTNLVMNPSFEGEGGWANTYDGASASSRVQTEADDGRWSLAIDKSETDAGEGWRSAAIPMAEGARYRVAARVFRELGAAPHVMVKFYDVAGTWLDLDFAAEAIAVANSWGSVSWEFVSPTAAVSARVVLYYLSNRLGRAYFDNIILARAPTQGLLDNQEFEQDPLGNRLPMHWAAAGTLEGEVWIAASPTDSAQRVVQLVDASGSQSGGLSASFGADPGTAYQVSVDVYLEQGSQPVHVHVRYRDKAGNVIASSSTESSPTKLEWQRLRVAEHSVAPAGTVRGEVLLKCLSNRSCSAFFDSVEVWEYWPTERHVAPQATGDGSGNSPNDAASWNDPGFWAAVDALAENSAVRVVFADGTYLVTRSGASAQLRLTGFGSPGYRVQLEGATVFGSHFVVAEPIGVALAFVNSRNVTLKNLQFTAVDSAATAGHVIQLISDASEAVGDVAESFGGRLIGVRIRDVLGVGYSGVSIRTKTTDASTETVRDTQVRHSEFIRIGSHAGAHSIYATFQVDGLALLDSFFEDCSGTYVKLKGPLTNSRLHSNRFVSTGNYEPIPDARPHLNFVQAVTYNVVGDVDQWFGGGHLWANNVFTFAGSLGLCEGRCIPLLVSHYGDDPVDDSGVSRRHRLTAVEGATMADLSAAATTARHAIMRDNFWLPPNDCTAGICLSGNTWAGVDSVFRLYTTADDAAGTFGGQSLGGDGAYDISALFAVGNE